MALRTFAVGNSSRMMPNDSGSKHFGQLQADGFLEQLKWLLLELLAMDLGTMLGPQRPGPAERAADVVRLVEDLVAQLTFVMEPATRGVAGGIRVHGSIPQAW